MTEVAALLFDVDGTLVDTEEIHRQAFNQAFLTFGLGWEWAPDLYADLLAVSGGVERMAAHIDRLDTTSTEKTRLRQLVPSVHREKTRIYGELLSSSAARLRPGVERLIKDAQRAGIKVGLAATSAAANVQSLVAAAFGPDSRRIVTAIVCVDWVARKKPAPDVYELLLSTLRVHERAAVAFEDSANGVAAAKAAGLVTVATPSRWTRGQDLRAADLILPSLGDPHDPLPPLLAARLGGVPYLGLAQVESLLHSRGPAASRAAAT
ncbi:MAG: HAD-IA family hydrolase [Alphaproteobacteria bacterium]|nr:HAD-IA family hydrolase [Alphaproteobacteria bacterium]